MTILDTLAKGEASVGIILAALLRAGEAVLIPFGNSKRCDLVVDRAGRFIRLQCKTGLLKNGCVVFNSCSHNALTGKRFGYRGHIDFFMVYCPQTDKIYKVPVESVGQSSVVLRVDPPKNGQKSKINLANDFVFLGEW